MTQHDDAVEKLARELAEAAISPQLFVAWDAGIGTILLQMRTYDRMLPILIAHFAARDAELQRLREAATKSWDAFNSLDGAIYEENDLVSEACHALKAALHPNHQEPSE